MNILDFIIGRNLDCLVKFGLTDFDHQLLFFRQVLERIGVEQILRWQELLLKPVYWPAVSLGPEDEHYGWKVRPDPFYFEMAERSRILWKGGDGNEVVIQKPWILQAGVYLVDTRQKPPHRYWQKKAWTAEESFISRYLQMVRKERIDRSSLLSFQFPLSSPFCVDGETKRMAIQLLCQQSDFRSVISWRNERASEFNFIPQCFFFMPRRWDGEILSSVIFDDILLGKGGGKNFLTGGVSTEGGLAHISSVDFERAGSPLSPHFFRLIGILALES